MADEPHDRISNPYFSGFAHDQPLSVVDPTPELGQIEAPWTIKLAIKSIFWFGPSIVVAGLFLAMWAGWLSSPITDNNTRLIRIESKLDRAFEEMRNRVLESKVSDEQGVRLLLVICHNTAKNEAQNVACDYYWKAR